MKTKIKLILGAVLLGSSIIFTLYLLSAKADDRQPFTRNILDTPVIESRTIDIEFNSYYIAGAASGTVYLGNTVTPFRVLEIRDSLRTMNLVDVNAMPIEKDKFKAAQLVIDSPFFYINDGNIPTTLRGTLEDMSIEESFIDSVFYTVSVNLDSNSSIFRILSRSLGQYVLVKEKRIPFSIKRASQVLTKQVDGVFCTDGMLLYNAQAQRVIYVYHYRNQFISLDRDLNIIYRGNTIDTISIAQVSVTKINSGQTYTLSAPPLLVNKKSCTSEKYLFINSALIGQNEKQKLFANASVIDVYDLKDGAYRFSFYLFDHIGYKVGDFKVYNNTLFAVHGRYLISYSLNPKYFAN